MTFYIGKLNHSIAGSPIPTNDRQNVSEMLGAARRRVLYINIRGSVTERCQARLDRRRWQPRQAETADRYSITVSLVRSIGFNAELGG